MDSRLRHEAFVSNNNGTSIAEINIITSCHVISYFAYLLVYASFSRFVFLKGAIAKFLLQFVFIILPPFLSFTILADHLLIFCTLLFFIPFFPYIILSFSSQHQKDEIKKHTKSSIATHSTEGLKHRLKSQELETKDTKINNTSMGDSKPIPNLIKNQETLPKHAYRPSFLSNSRAYVLVQTCISILAIDFAVSPRRFAKTETTGFGVMDAGVGLFIVCNSVVDPVIRSTTEGWRGWKHVVKTNITSFISTWPLLLSFILRVISLQSLNYQQHVSEYGVHWNFFLTLVCLKVISNFCNSIFSPKQNFVMAFIISIVYEVYLEKFTFREYILSSGARIGLVDMNKEGLYSLIGNYFLYVSSLELGKMMYQHYIRNPSTTTSPLRLKCSLIIKLTCVSVCLWLCLYLYLYMGFDVSRRMANIGYVTWVLAICTKVMALSLLAEVLITYLLDTINVAEPTFEPELLASMTYNSFFFFLLANVLTGVINLSISTINTNASNSMLIMSIYLMVLSVISNALYAYRLKLKFW